MESFRYKKPSSLYDSSSRDHYTTTYSSSFNSPLRQTTNGNHRHASRQDHNEKDSLSRVADRHHGERRLFHPTDRDWQEIKAKKLGLQVVKHNRYGSQKYFYDKTPPTETISVRADGNCFFRAICVIITGAEDEHMKVREAITKHVSDNPDMYRSFLLSRGGMSEYLNNMRRSREWATDVELLATATLLKTVIEVYFPYPVNKSETEYRWQTFKPLNNPDITSPAIYISNKYDHFDPVLDIDATTDELDRHSYSSDRRYNHESSHRNTNSSDELDRDRYTLDRHRDIESKSPTRKHSHGAITF